MDNSSYPIPDKVSLQRFSEKDRNDSERARLIQELIQFGGTTLAKELKEDHENDLKQVMILLIEGDKDMTDAKLHALRGEAQALFRTWDRIAEFAEILENEVNQKTEQ